MTAAAFGFILTLVGALETSDIAFLPRLAYWEVLMLSGAMIGLGVSEAVERWGRLRSRPWLEMPLIAALIALPMTMIVIGTSTVFFGIRAPGLNGFSVMFGLTFVISLAMTALNYLMHWPGRVDPVVVFAPASPARPVAEVNRFAERLPLPLRGLEIIALQAEDHYLRVHLKGGQNSLILLRLSDALTELPPGLGAQTHRSWWVAKDAVRAVAKGDGRATLTLEGGIEAPVSRSFYKALGQSGWLT